MEHINVIDLKSRLDNGEELHIIDCREQDEYDEKNIGALLLPLSQLNQMDAEPIEHLKDKEIIVHCRSGKRSMQACMILEQLGFERTVNVDGGILAWIENHGEATIR